MSYIRRLQIDGLNNDKSGGAEHIKNLLAFLDNIVVWGEKTAVHPMHFCAALVQNNNFQKFLNGLLKMSDVDIDGANFVDVSDEKARELFKGVEMPSSVQKETDEQIVLSNNNGDYYVLEMKDGIQKGRKLKIQTGGKDFDLNELSTGTRKIIQLALALWNFKNDPRGGLLVIDEMDCSLHPVIVKKLLQELLNGNKYGAQILISLHNTLLMDIQNIWRDDEIWFVQKDYDHSSRLSSLADFAPRADKVVERDYLNGKYGAIPFLGANLFLGDLEQSGDGNGKAE
jgi:hypothetical protein